MKCGDIIGIGSGKQVSLLCRVEEITDEYIKFHVINGAWTGYLRGELVEVGDEQYGEFDLRATVDGQKVVYIGPHRGRDYNEAIDFMNQALARNWLSRRLFIGRLNVERSMKSFWSRLAKSCQAFSDAWYGRAAYDDTIPF